MQKHRIHTNIGRDQKINVEIKQEWDLMEILSLKFSQKDVYSSGSCSEYGVVVGRISANNGFGIPNVRVSIFVAQSDIDEDDPVISALYPYKTVSDKDENNYRYNLLPSRQQHAGHAPTGTFPDQQDILTREEVLEVFEKYYKYTVKTNSSGDFMIWGVPVGTQILHVDADLSDIGCFSLRPFDYIKKGVGIDKFERHYKFKSSTDIDGLPQIVTFDKTIQVYPFWGNEELCEIGITRSDFDLTERDIRIEPVSLILVSSVTDDSNHSVKRNGRIRKNSGYKCNLQTLGGTIECVRYTGRYVYASDGITRYPELEYFNLNEVIDDNGVAMAVLPMNMEYVYTNEFGEEEITNDANKGIPTTAIARFRFGLDFESHKISTAKYLVPNIREFNPNYSTGQNDKDEYNEGMLASYQFSDVFEDYITVTPPSGVTINSTGYDSSSRQHKKELMLGTNNNDIPEDYFYKFIFGKVYAVSSFQGSHYDGSRRDAFLGIKQIRPNAEEDCSSATNYFPVNFGFKNRIKFNLLVSQVLLFIQFIYSVILLKFSESIGKTIYIIGYDLYNLRIINWFPLRKPGERFINWAYKIQDRFTQQHSIVVYPDCEDCTSDDETYIEDSSFDNLYCRIAEVKLKMYCTGGFVHLYSHDADSGTTFCNSTLTGTSFLSGMTMFYGESARDNEGGCTGNTITFEELDTLHTFTIIDKDPNAQYVGEVYSVPYADIDTATGITSFANFVLYFDTGEKLPAEETFFYTQDILGEPSHLLHFRYDEWEYLTGMDMTGCDDPGTCAFDITDTYAVIRIYDRLQEKETSMTGQTMYIEEGCEKYDKLYNEDLVYRYLYSPGYPYGSSYLPLEPPNDYPNGMIEATTNPGGYDLLSTLIGNSSTGRMPRSMKWKKIPDALYDRKTKSGLSEFRDGTLTVIPVIRGTSKNLGALQEWYRRKRIGMFFCGGVVNFSFIDNWLTGILYFFKFDKRIKWDSEGNWDLNQRSSKFPRELIFYHVFDKTFYYRSTPYYYSGTGIFTGQTFDDGKHTEIDSPNLTLEILHPTTFYDMGVRDEFLNEICTDSRIDPYCSVIRDVTHTSYQDPANIVEYAINYRLDTNDSNFDLNEFFSGLGYGYEDGQDRNQNTISSIRCFDGDIIQMMSINCEAGIEAFDIDGSHYYIYNGELMDPEDQYFSGFTRPTGSYEPTPIDLKLDSNGAFMRLCLNYRLGDYSQVVPFYLWDKGGPGFGTPGDEGDKQKWDRTEIATMKLQRIFSISGTTDATTNYIMADGEEEYILKPMTITHNTFEILGPWEDMLERFEVISDSPPDDLNDTSGYIEGDLWLHVTSGTIADPQIGTIYVVVNKTWVSQGADLYVDGYRETFIFQTDLNYRGNKQVLSTPFLFYFGLKPGKTAIDLLTKYFGPKGAFPSSEEDVVCPG